MAWNSYNSKRATYTAAKLYRGMVRTFRSSPKRKKTLILVAGVVLLAVLAGLVMWVPSFKAAVYRGLGITRATAVAQEVHSSTKVHFIDVGQGDAMLLEQSGEFALIDAGPPECRDDLLAYLDGVGVKKLRYVFITHPHADHYGSMRAVLRQYKIGTMVLPNLEKGPAPTAYGFQNILTTLAEKEIPTQTIRLGAVYPLGQGEVRVLQDGLETEDNFNLLSPTLLFTAEGLRFLNSGDAEKENEYALLDSGENPRADVMMAAHHGSSTSNTNRFVQAVNPSVMVVSCAKNNDHGHPHREVMQTCRKQGITVLRTDQNGTVVLGLDEKGKLMYAVEKEEAPAAALLPAFWPHRRAA